jgi:hypothetical protein
MTLGNGPINHKEQVTNFQPIFRLMVELPHVANQSLMILAFSSVLCKVASRTYKGRIAREMDAEMRQSFSPFCSPKPFVQLFDMRNSSYF